VTLRGLDDLDRRILAALQRDARHVSSRDIAREVSASPSTVRKRIQRLEREGVVTAYHATVDYQRAGYQLHVQIVCTAPVVGRDRMASEALEVPGVVAVRELATGECNVVVTAITEDGDDLARVAAALSSIGLTVVDEELVHNDRNRPFSGFEVPATATGTGTGSVSESESGD
jgi:DNA-binding Lrp family transcriptional regulator